MLGFTNDVSNVFVSNQINEKYDMLLLSSDVYRGGGGQGHVGPFK